MWVPLLVLLCGIRAAVGNSASPEPVGRTLGVRVEKLYRVERTLSDSADEEKETKSRYKQYVGEQQYRLPFKTRISESFKEGQTIHAVGMIAKDPTKIEFNFHKGANDNDDMPLHLAIRFDEGVSYGVIVYNAMKDGKWASTEQRLNSPFAADEEFDIRIRIRGSNYQVFGNRREIGTLKQQQPIDGVNHVSITGCLSNLTVFHYGGKAMNNWGYWEESPGATIGTIFPTPYYAIARLTPGKRLDISALPTGPRVNINLQRRAGEYAVHISIRYNEGAIVRNAMNDRQWGVEERSGGFPLSKAEVFDLTIVNEHSGFVLLLNGKEFATFAHRGPYDDIETLEVDGNVELLTVTINDA